MVQKCCENVEDDERSGRPRPRIWDENVEKMRNLVNSDRRFIIIQVYYVEILKLLPEAGRIKGLKFGPVIGFPTMTLHQLTRRCQAVSGPKIDY
jgi:hypothetical protein